MQYVYLGAIIGLCFYNLWSYRRGLKDGLTLNQGKPIEPIQNPIRAVINRVEAKAEKKATQENNTAMNQGFQNLMSYTGDPQEKAGEK